MYFIYNLDNRLPKTVNNRYSRRQSTLIRQCSRVKYGGQTATEQYRGRLLSGHLGWLRSVVDDRRYEGVAAGLHPGGGAVGEGRMESGSSERDAILGGCNGDHGHQEEKGHLQGIRSSADVMCR